MAIEQNIIYSLCGILIAGLIGFGIYQHFQILDLQKIQSANFTQQQQLKDFLERSSSQYISKSDFDAFVKSNGVNLDEIKKDIRTFNGQLESINVAIATSNKQIVVNQPGTYIVNPGQDISVTAPHLIDTFDWYKKTASISLVENFGSGTNFVNVPIGSVSFNASNSTPWTSTIESRSYKNVSVITHTSDERTIVYNQFSIDVNGKSYKIPVNSETKEIFPESQFFFIPRVFLGVNAGASFNNSTKSLDGVIIPTVEANFISYGKYSHSPTWQIANLGLGYGTDNKVYVTLSPVSYNLNEHLPFLKNTFVTATVGINQNANFFGGLGIKVAL